MNKILFEPSNVHQGHYVIINGETSGIIVNLYAYEMIEEYKKEVGNKIEEYIKMKRFQIIDPSGRTENTKYNSIKEIVSDLLSNKRDMSLQNYYVECLIDDIEIEADELIKAWNEGERPEDLQMF
jgi:uncharacterized UBP type Zn finger protein